MRFEHQCDPFGLGAVPIWAAGNQRLQRLPSDQQPDHRHAPLLPEAPLDGLQRRGFQRCFFEV